MIAVVQLQLAGLGVRRVIVHSIAYAVAFMQFVEDHVAALVFMNVVVDPHLPAWDVLIHMLVPTLRELDVVDTPDQTPFDDPHAHAAGERLPEFSGYLGDIGKPSPA